jgi:hypothetical protein
MTDPKLVVRTTVVSPTCDLGNAIFYVFTNNGLSYAKALIDTVLERIGWGRDEQTIELVRARTAHYFARMLKWKYTSLSQ